MTMVVILVSHVVVVKTIVRSVCDCFISLLADGIDLVQRYDMRQLGYKKSVYMVDRCWYSSLSCLGSCPFLVVCVSVE